VRLYELAFAVVIFVQAADQSVPLTAVLAVLGLQAGTDSMTILIVDGQLVTLVIGEELELVAVYFEDFPAVIVYLGKRS